MNFLTRKESSVYWMQGRFSRNLKAIKINKQITVDSKAL
jgi:hypothetical protein